MCKSTVDTSTLECKCNEGVNPAAFAGYDLLPCPFCGGDAAFDYDDDGWNWIECSQCHTSSKAGVSAMEDCKPMLAEAWNLRRDMSLSLEKQYAENLGRLAQLCDKVLPWLQSVISGVPDSEWPKEIREGYSEIMDYVDAVRP